MKPRLEGVDADRIAWMLTSLDQRIESTPEETDYRLHREYQARAQLRFAAGFPAEEVAHDVLWSARCLRFKEDLHFLKVPPERFRSRRIDPVEVAAASGDDVLAKQIAERYAVAAPTVVAGMADPALMREVRTVTRCFDGDAQDSLDLAGMGALCWSAALGAVVRGFEDEAMMAASLFRRACAAAPDLADPESCPPLGRYQRLFEILEVFRAGDGPALAVSLGRLAVEHLAVVRDAMTEEEWSAPLQAPRYLDLTALALSVRSRMMGTALVRTDLPEEASVFADLLADG